MNEDEIAEVLLQLAEQSSATSDVLSIICLHLADQIPEVANQIAQTLENISSTQETQKTQSFLALSSRLVQALRSEEQMELLGVEKMPSFGSSRQALLQLLESLRNPKIGPLPP